MSAELKISTHNTLSDEEAVRLLIAGETEVVCRHFAFPDRRPPVLKWDPAPDTLPLGELVKFLETWQAMPRHPEFGLPLAADFDVLDFRFMFGHLMMLDVIDDGADFRYRVYGGKIAHFSGLDLTKKLLSTCPAPSISVEFFMVNYRAVVARKQPLFAEHNPPPSFLVATWSRVIVPLVGRDGRVIRLLGANIPSECRTPMQSIRSVYGW